tara:strand:- start:900 stop:1541 length:642 start_codon:yes stop_codon:yes gene_type:complete
MAANEHKNLTSANRHNPKGFENANNETVLSKGAGSSAAARDGLLQWAARSTMGVTNYKMQGYVTGALNYKYGEDIADTKSPFEMAVDYGSTRVSGGSILPAECFRVGQGCTIPEISSVISIDGWITCNTGNSITIAICKVTPVTGVNTAVVPIVIDEITVVGGSNNNNLIRVNDSTIATAALAEGDIIFPMIKESGEIGSTIYMNLVVQTTTF